MNTVRIAVSQIGALPLADHQAPENRLTAVMPLAKFEGMLKMNPAWREIHLMGNGEPLLVPNLMDMVRSASRVRPRIHTTLRTNGTLLYRDRAEEMVAAGLGELHVMLSDAARVADGLPALPRRRVPLDHFGSPWLENLAGLVGARAGGPTPRIKVAYRLNARTLHALPDTLWLLGSLGVTEVATITGGRLSDRLAPPILRRAVRAANEWGIEVTEVADGPSTRPYINYEGLWVYPPRESAVRELEEAAAAAV